MALPGAGGRLRWPGLPRRRDERVAAAGRPVAHLGYFRAEFVERRRWLDEEAYIDIVALCQFLPGPASSQTGITLGILRAGLPGAVAAWLGFSGPSALAMILFGYG